MNSKPKCNVCREAEFKYKCSKCITPICSLVCYKDHKENSCGKNTQVKNKIALSNNQRITSQQSQQITPKENILSIYCSDNDSADDEEISKDLRDKEDNDKNIDDLASSTSSFHASLAHGNTDREDNDSDDSESVTSFSSLGVSDDMMEDIGSRKMNSRAVKKRGYQQEAPAIRDDIQEPLAKRSRNLKSKSKGTLHPDFPAAESRHKKDQSVRFEDLLATFQTNAKPFENMSSSIKRGLSPLSIPSSSTYGRQRQRSPTIMLNQNQSLPPSVLSDVKKAMSATLEYYKQASPSRLSSTILPNVKHESDDDFVPASDDDDSLRLKPEQLEKLRNSEKIREFLRDDTLREIIYHIDRSARSSEIEKLLDAARLNDEVFYNFTEEILNLVTTRDSDH